MDSTISVRHADLTALVSALRRSHGRIAGHLDELDHQAGELRGQWSGEAAGAYDRAHAAWTRKLEAMASILAETTDLAERAAEAHRATEAAVVALW